ncbi:hypothetical protein BOX15_Mlig024950g1 [Macrostomum lignano]|uniref:Uncharacterized protein n=2 Tax=Macrostomum lignano TaxID=282301 RepID=A0A267FVD4_9PLAT|nr:hypothetical protein BOX15_Mlig024950g3 [Macrostomum lignano]PAA78360.1 hypothetical protein BOX15_Mlig024950g2 [Macrostomum lignano]PAA89036.1 hypothetical protein BOX15_Mlig024950g1 [Macrostomum lignano]
MAAPCTVTMEMITEATDFVRARYSEQPEIGIVCGSGLGELADSVEEPAVRIRYGDIPHFAQSTVHGHSGVLVLGRLAGRRVCVMQGRLHPYEGLTYLQCSFPMRVMAKLGVSVVILTNAAGSLRPEFQPGDIMTIRDHINFPGFSGRSPLQGLSPEVFGDRFVPMNNAYDKKLRDKVAAAAAASGVSLRTGVYAMLGGPHFETPAECRMLRSLGADVVGMSTVHETIVARQCKVRVIGFSIITNVVVTDSDSELDQTGVHLEVLKASKLAANRLQSIIAHTIDQL